jgi:hypothetical protein
VFNFEFEKTKIIILKLDFEISERNETVIAHHKKGQNIIGDDIL